MTKQDRYAKYQLLRKEFPVFAYESCHLAIEGADLKISFRFRAGHQYTFQPHIILRDISLTESNLEDPALHSMAFHIGLVEMISYWKAFCSPVIHIDGFRLDEKQQMWWKKLFIFGLGEFFFTNGIPIPGDEIFTCSFSSHAKVIPPAISGSRLSGSLLPVGGGKDSAVCLELLKNHYADITPFVINPRPATDRVISSAGISAQAKCIMHRHLDPLIMQLNERGYLNGHTPFSALLAFNTILVAYLTNKKHIILSNESSASEPSIPGTMINHQYSKSLDFETDFRQYVSDYLHTDINYFSFLRPLNELQISGLFSGMPHQHAGFRSCNAGSKSDIWCCTCSKCLFTYIMMAPFLDEQALIAIFGANLFDQKELLSTLYELCGEADNKPFECVGTIDEVNAALAHMVSRYIRSGKEPPSLLRHYQGTMAYRNNSQTPIERLLYGMQPIGYLDEKQREILEAAISETKLRVES